MILKSQIMINALSWAVVFLICHTYCAMKVYVGFDDSHHHNILTEDTTKSVIKFVTGGQLCVIRAMVETGQRLIDGIYKSFSIPTHSWFQGAT